MKLSKALIAASSSGGSGAFLMTRDGTSPASMKLLANGEVVCFDNDPTYKINIYKINNTYTSINLSYHFQNGAGGNHNASGVGVNNDGNVVLYSTYYDYQNVSGSNWNRPRISILDPSDFSVISDKTATVNFNEDIYASYSPVNIPSSANMAVFVFEYPSSNSNYPAGTKIGQSDGAGFTYRHVKASNTNLGLTYTTGAPVGNINSVLVGTTTKDSTSSNADYTGAVRRVNSGAFNVIGCHRYRNPPSSNDRAQVWDIASTQNFVDGFTVAYYAVSGKSSSGSFTGVDIYKLYSNDGSSFGQLFFTSMGYGWVATGMAVNDTHDRIFVAMNTGSSIYLELMDDSATSIWAYYLTVSSGSNLGGQSDTTFDSSGNILWRTDQGVLFIPAEGLRAGTTDRYTITEATPVRGSQNLVAAGQNTSSSSTSTSSADTSWTTTSQTSNLVKSDI